MPTTALLRRGRAAAERLMTDRCQLGRPTGNTVLDPETMKEIPEVEKIPNPDAEDGLWPCKLQSTPDTGEAYDSGEHRYQTETPRLHLPIDTPVTVNDEAVIVSTVTESLGDGDRFRLVSVARKTHATAQRWNVEVVTG